MAKKTAMVSPPPAKKTPREIILPPTALGGGRPPRPKLQHDLAVVLQELGNDRPYVLISTADDHWLVHFMGDDHPTKIKK
jgi:hypothetical protein